MSRHHELRVILLCHQYLIRPINGRRQEAKRISSKLSLINNESFLNELYVWLVIFDEENPSNQEKIG